MASRLLRRRLATALGSWGSSALGIVGTVIAARILEPGPFGRLTLVLATVALFQLLLDLTSEEALVKYGFRYAERADWGRFRRLLEVTLAFKSASALAAAAIVVAISPLSDSVFGADLTVPLLIAASLPPLYALEGTAASVLILRERYDVRAWALFATMLFRLVAIVVGAPRGVTDTVIALVVAQVLATVFVGSLGVAAVRRFPRARREALGDERRDIVRFVLGSSLGTGLVSLRGWLAPVLLGVASDVRNVGLFRAAQAPQQGFGALTSPVRLILLTEQTRDWERGRPETVYAGVRRYALGAAVVMSAAVPLFWWLMPDLVRTVLGREYTGAVDAARIILIAAAVQVVFGWTKSFPVSIGRPSLRVVAHGAELAVLVPLLIVLGREWGATGAAGAVLAATIAFALVWTAIIVKLRGEAVPQVSTA